MDLPVLLLFLIVIVSSTSGYDTPNAFIGGLENYKKFYDDVTGVTVIKNYFTKKCYVQLPSQNKTYKQLVPTVTKFCEGYPFYVTAIDKKSQIRKRSTQHYFVGRRRGQTQSQYLNFGNSNEPGKAEAEFSLDGSRAVVTGSGGMGQAQSQSGISDCGDCRTQEQTLHYGRPGDLGAHTDIRRPEQPSSQQQGIRKPSINGQRFPDSSSVQTGGGANGRLPQTQFGTTSGPSGSLPNGVPQGSSNGGYPPDTRLPQTQFGTTSGQAGNLPNGAPQKSPNAGYPPEVRLPQTQFGTTSGQAGTKQEPPVAGYPSEVRFPGAISQQSGGGPGAAEYAGGGANGRYSPTQTGTFSSGAESAGRLPLQQPGAGNTYADQTGGIYRIPQGPGVQPISGTQYVTNGQQRIPGFIAEGRPGVQQTGFGTQQPTSGVNGVIQGQVPGQAPYYPQIQNGKQTPVQQSQFPAAPQQQFVTTGGGGRYPQEGQGGQFSGQFAGNYVPDGGSTGSFSGTFSGQYDGQPGGTGQYGGQQVITPQSGQYGPGYYPSSVQQGQLPGSPVPVIPNAQFIPAPSSSGQTQPNREGQFVQNGYPINGYTTGQESGRGVGGGEASLRPGTGQGQSYPGGYVSTTDQGRGTGERYRPELGIQGGAGVYPVQTNQQGTYGSDVGQGGTAQFQPGTSGSNGAGAGQFRPGVQLSPGTANLGTAQFGPGPTQFSPGTAGTTQFTPGAGTAQYGPGTTQFGQGPGGTGATQFGPGTGGTGATQFGPGTGGTGATQFGPGAGSSGATQFGPGIGSSGATQFGPGVGSSGATQLGPGAGSSGVTQFGPGTGSSGTTQFDPGAGSSGATQFGPSASQLGPAAGDSAQFKPGGITYGPSGGSNQFGPQYGPNAVGPQQFPDQGLYPPVQQFAPEGQPIRQDQTYTNGYDVSGGAAEDDSDSQAQSSVQQINNETQATASAQGTFAGGTAQSQVQGTYYGTGSFTASAGTSDGRRGAQTQISGGDTGVMSSAQGTGGLGQSQAQVLLSTETGETTSNAQSGGYNHGTNSQVQANEKGGMADAQANGPGNTSSQAQIGFTPYSENDTDDQETPFKGGGTASAQGGAYSGQTQSQITGKFRFGIKYTGSAQAQSGGSAAPGNVTSFKPLAPFALINSTRQIHSSNRQNFSSGHSNKNLKQPVSSTTLRYEGSTTSETPEYYDEYEDYDDEEKHKIGTKSITQTSSKQKQHIILDPLEDLDANVHQAHGNDGLKHGMVLQPGQQIPGSSGYRIPQGFRGKVISLANGANTAAFGPNSQAQSVTLKPGHGKVIYSRPLYQLGSKTHLYNGNYGYGSGYTYQPVTYKLKSGKSLPNFVAVTKSETGSQDLYTGKRTPSVYYSQSSTCGYFTNTCVFNGKTKVCTPKPKTNPDGTPVIC